MLKAVLVDLRKCMACRGCQVACKQWNELEGEETVNRGSYENPPDLSTNTWTLIKFKEIEQNGRLKWLFSRWGCMHCLYPACVTVCPTEALYKTEEGPVLYDEKRCIGCEYCVTACPFFIPRFNWAEERIVRKCTMCVDRITNGLEPACVKSCPPGALRFGDREVIIAKANEAEAEGAYLYGRDEVGGTSWIYISDVPIDERGFPDVGTLSYPKHSLRIWGSQIASMGVGVALIWSLSWYLKRRTRLENAGGEK